MRETSERTRGIAFLGSFVHQMDEKGRVSLPASFRREAAEARFVLVQAYPPALSLFTESSWIEVEDRLKDLLRRKPEARPWALSILANVFEVSPDGQGRILIPERLRQAAGLDGQVQLVGAMDRIELWNPEAFGEVVERSRGEFERFAPQIFL